MINVMNDDVAKVEIYESADGKAQVDVRFEQETVWLTQAQMSELFGRDQSVISRHIANAINDEEIAEKSNMQKMHIANSDRPVTFYDLDVVISVGYRIKSPQGVQFRRWATQRLREYLVQGYTLNQERFDKNSSELQQALNLIRKTAQSPELKTDEGRGLVEIISRYTQTFLWYEQMKQKRIWWPSIVALVFYVLMMIIIPEYVLLMALIASVIFILVRGALTNKGSID